MTTPKKEPPMPEEKPDNLTWEIAVAYCYECKEVIGPDLSESVGEEISFQHHRHEFELIDTWDEDEDGEVVG